MPVGPVYKVCHLMLVKTRGIFRTHSLTVNYFPKKSPSQMFDWVLNTPLNTIAILFPGVSKLKLMSFSIFFSTINFSCQYLPEAKGYLELSRTFYKGDFREIFFVFAKSTKTFLCWSLILIKLQISVLQLH